jgi:nucleotide-binding universal stress UspA family protein
MRITVVPGALAQRFGALDLSDRWELRAAKSAGADLGIALRAGAEGPVLFVPKDAQVPDRLNQVLVPHDGTPATTLALDTASEMVAGSRFEVVVLHVPAPEFPVEPGSLPAPRLVDHVSYDLPEWREEFSRRFFHRSLGLLLRLEVRVGPVAESILDAAQRLPADLLVLGWQGVMEEGRAATVRSVCAASPCPVLLVAVTPGSEPAARYRVAGTGGMLDALAG